MEKSVILGDIALFASNAKINVIFSSGEARRHQRSDWGRGGTKGTRAKSKRLQNLKTKGPKRPKSQGAQSPRGPKSKSPETLQ